MVVSMRRNRHGAFARLLERGCFHVLKRLPKRVWSCWNSNDFR
ncbi:hypothetical protein BIFDEN_01141 [Bifidobacterium dentium ATCC 27678]|nr:hypothetical protein BIFDEN_01141 [Bifidobacterium dentium ATCC 27678]